MILNQQKNVRLARKPLEAFLKRVQRELGVKGADVTVCFVSDRQIGTMNQRFRRKKGATDVLSFPAENQWRVTSGEWRARKRIQKRRARDKKGKQPSRDFEREDFYLGDIAIAPETARRYAKENGRSLDSELRVLILHGVLHLLGYDHETDRGEMDRMEQKLRRTFGLV